MTDACVVSPDMLISPRCANYLAQTKWTTIGNVVVIKELEWRKVGPRRYDTSFMTFYQHLHSSH